MGMGPNWFTPMLGFGRDTRDMAIGIEISRALHSHAAARRALADAIAAQRLDANRRAHFAARARDLETRAVAALRAGHEDLAVRASEAIAAIECELEAADLTAVEQAAAVATLRRTVEDQRRRLSELERGRRLASVQGAIIDSRSIDSSSGDPLSRAEAALAELSGQRKAMLEIEPSAQDGSASLVEEMAEAGFGGPPRPASRNVLARIRAAAVELDENGRKPVGHLPAA